jgi:anaerobic ribonucleoside-triphosphate reductase activating protein
VQLYVHAAVTGSSCNGPGLRIVIWTQGCRLACAGCFNSPTHHYNHRIGVEVTALADKISAWLKHSPNPIRGLTLSGGEPLNQAGAIAALIDLVDPALDILLFTGFSPAELFRSSAMRSVIKKCDAILAGRYQKELAHPYQGKHLLLRTGRIRADELAPHTNAELFFDGSNNGLVTGFPRKHHGLLR